MALEGGLQTSNMPENVGRVMVGVPIQGLWGTEVMAVGCLLAVLWSRNRSEPSLFLAGAVLFCQLRLPLLKSEK